MEPIWKKMGFKTDMDYFKFSYAGKNGEVIKRYTKLLGKTHPFFIIKRKIDPYYGKNRYEFKIYDLYRDGFIEKKVMVEDEETEIPSITAWFDSQNKGSTHFREYVRFCYDSNKF